MTIERVSADDEAAVTALFNFLLPMAREVALWEPEYDYAFKNIWRACTEDNTFVAKDQANAIVGAVSMVKVGPPFSCWYAPKTYLIDQFFYVGAGQRFGTVGRELLRAVRELAAPLDMPAFVKVMNPSRERERGIGPHEATILYFSPVGHVTRIR